MEYNVKFSRKNGFGATVHPLFPDVQHFASIGETENEEKEMHLLDAIARIGIDNGMSVNDLIHIFPAILRMLKHNSEWTK